MQFRGRHTMDTGCKLILGRPAKQEGEFLWSFVAVYESTSVSAWERRLDLVL